MAAGSSRWWSESRVKDNEKDRGPLYRLARSGRLRERRIAIIATHVFIARRDFADTPGVVEVLVGDPYDLICKAAGWMLREVGKRDRETLDGFSLADHSPEVFCSDQATHEVDGSSITNGLAGRATGRSDLNGDEPTPNLNPIPAPNTVWAADGTVFTAPEGWILLPPWEPGLPVG
jgi:hypothetical protein